MISTRETTAVTDASRMVRAAVIGAGLALAATVAPASAEEAPSGAGKHLFETHCRICHADDLAKKSYGPPLAGVIGRKAGTYPGFAYSDAMKAAGFTWTESAVKAWMADNTHMLPGTKMRHVGVTDAAEQELIVAYLKTISK